MAFHTVTSRAYLLLYVATVLLIFLNAISSSAHAAHNYHDVNEVGSRIPALEALSSDSRWLKLLHVNAPLFGELSSHSDVASAAFFLSDRGPADPHAELIAMVAAIEKGEDQAICRFPARAQFINEQFQLRDSASLLNNCTQLNSWLHRINADHIVLVFASSYLNSPSSMYGHTLLRIDPPGVERGSKWLSHAVSFAAVVQSDDNSLFYAWKGLAGGYPGFFSMLPYYEKIQEYNKLENRDLWEYRLNLTRVEVDRLMLHLWELDRVEFPYYFLDENCAYRLLELIDIARPQSNVTAEFGFTVIPVDTVKAVVDKGMIDHLGYRASKATELDALRRHLDKPLQQLALHIAEDSNGLRSAQFLALDQTAQHRVVALAYRTLRYRTEAEQRDSAIARRSHQLLLALQAMPIVKADEDVVVPTAPEFGHPSRSVAINAGHIAGGADFSELQLRLSYHDLLDPLPGYSKGASLNMMDLRLREVHDVVRLQRADLVEITSLAPRDEFFDPLSWMVRGGAERLSDMPDAPLLAHVTGGAGVTYALGDDASISVLPGARLEYNHLWQQETDLAVAGNVSLQWQRAMQSARLIVAGVAFGNGVQRTHFGASYQYSFNVRHALRFEYALDDTEIGDAQSLSLAYRHYF
jgi:hypothetical protein